MFFFCLLHLFLLQLLLVPPPELVHLSSGPGANTAREGGVVSVLHPGTPVQTVLHYPDELFVGELVIVIYIKDLEDGVYEVTGQLQPSGHIHSSCKLILSNGASGEIVHLHGNGKVLEVVEKLEEGSKLIKGDSLLIRYTLADILQVGADVFHIGEAQKDFSKVFFTDGGHPFRVGQKLNFQHFCLKVIHKPVEVIKRKLCLPFLPKEMDQ